MKTFILSTIFLCTLTLFAQPAELKVGSYNMRCNADKAPNDWKSRAPRAVAVIKAEKFDIFGTQEVQQCHIDTLLAAGYKFIGKPRDKRRNPEYSAIFYNSDTVELIKSETFWLSDTPQVFASKSWGNYYPRICTVGFFRHKVSGREFIFANTHLDHRSAKAQIKGMELIVKRLADIENSIPCILTGDFNSRPDSAPLKSISAFMIDARNAAKNVLPGPEQTFHAYQPDAAKRRQQVPIDYIFVNANAVEVKTFQVIDDFKDGLASSDHFPLAAEIVFK